MSNYKDRILSLQPVAYYPLDDRGGVARDFSLNANHGAFVNTPTLNRQPLINSGTSVYFSRASQEYVSSSFTGITGSNPVTVEAWIKINSFPGSSVNVIVMWGANSSGTRFDFHIDSNHKLALEITNSSIVTVDTLSTNTVYHVVVTSPNSDLTNSKIYVNGESWAYTGSGIRNTASGNFKIGSLQPHASGFEFDGTIDEVAVYDYVLSEQQVRENYIIGATRLNEFNYTQLVSIQNQLPTNFFAKQTWIPKKPTGEVTVDWSHPQAKNLAAFILFDGTSNAFDLVSGQQLNFVGATTYLRGSTVGDSSDLDSSDNFTLLHDSNFFKQQTEYTVVWHGVLDSTANFQHFVGKHPGNGGGGDNYFDFRSEGGNTTVVIAGSGVNSGLPLTIGDTRVGFSRHYPENKVHFYVDGATSTQSLSSVVTTEYTGPLYIGRRPDGACQIDGAVSCVAVWARSFEADEFKQVADNPYLILKSANENQYDFYSIESIGANAVVPTFTVSFDQLDITTYPATITQTAANVILSIPDTLAVTTYPAAINAGLVQAGYDQLTITTYPAILTLNPVEYVISNPQALAVTTYPATFSYFTFRTERPRIKIQWKYKQGNINFKAGIKWIANEGTEDFVVGIQWEGEKADFVVGIQWRFSEVFTPTIDIEWQGESAYSYPQYYESWDIALTINGTDFSSKLIENVTIDYEEDAAAIAEFAIVPDTGAIDIMSWMNDLVEISVTTDTGQAQITTKRYKGYIMDANYDPERRIIYFTATNDLQGYFEQLTKDQINTAFGGINNPNVAYSAWWSPFVFNKEVTGWEYAQDLLSTIPVRMWLDENMRLRFDQYQSAGTADITFQDNARFMNTLELTRATRRDLINNVDINVDYLGYRLREKLISYRISFPNTNGAYVCELIDIAAPWLLKSQVYEAVDSLSWDFAAEPKFLEIPNEAEWCTYRGCIGGFWGGCEASARITNISGDGISSAYFQLFKHWVLTAKEQYTIKVWASDSYNRSGNFRTEIDLGVESQYDPSWWEEANVYTSSSSPYEHSWWWSNSLPTRSLGDYEYDPRGVNFEGNQVDLDIAQKTAINTAKVSILNSHRQNTVSFVVPYNHDLRLNKTVQVEADYLTAKGKVRKYTENFDFASGEIQQEIQVALSVHGGTGLAVNTPVTEITPPQSSNTQSTYLGTTTDGMEVYKLNQVFKNDRWSNLETYHKDLGTFIGGWYDTTNPNVKVYDENGDWTGQYDSAWPVTVDGSTVIFHNDDGACIEGYYANTTRDKDAYHFGYSYGYINNTAYPIYSYEGIVLQLPEITEEETVATGLTAENTYDVAVPQDVLIITA